MRHHRYNPDFKFAVSPEEFNKYSDREFLQYCLGATMYMPGTKDFSHKILEDEIPGLTSLVMCFEDACREDEVFAAENNVLAMLERVSTAIDEGNLTYEQIPLIFCRVRDVDQFKHFAGRLTKHQVKVLAGITFPKFGSGNGEEYFQYLQLLNEHFGEILYGMPIIEDRAVAYKETRVQELLDIHTILDKYKDLVLQVRVGGTDFSSYFGVRRGVDYSIYDILTVSECLTDILNVLARNNDYTVSGPVWEYFRASKDMMFRELPKYDVPNCILKRIPIINDEVDGLLREVILDKANGFVGRTVIHPSHIKYVNAMQAVTSEEYEDACQILGSKAGGVLKSLHENKMNEMKPHRTWAMRVYMRSRAYGVIQDQNSYFRLLGIEGKNK